MTDDTYDQRPSPSLTRTLIGGAVAGVAASVAMNGFQTLLTRAQETLDSANGGTSEGGGDDTPSTVRAADALSEAVTGHDVPNRDQAAAGRAVHYATGVGLGVLYTAMGRWMPTVRSGWGTGYGIAAAAVLDEGLVPALGLAPKPTDIPVSDHAYGAASHIAFGLALETVTRVVVGAPRE